MSGLILLLPVIWIGFVIHNGFVIVANAIQRLKDKEKPNDP